MCAVHAQEMNKSKLEVYPAKHKIPDPPLVPVVTFPPEIARVIIGCYKGDYIMARCCIASVRRWNPDIPI